MSEVDDLPKNVIRLSVFKSNYSKKKHCECCRSWPKKPPRYEIDFQNREVICVHQNVARIPLPLGMGRKCVSVRPPFLLRTLTRLAILLVGRL
jgi:hypothetical protein